MNIFYQELKFYRKSTIAWICSLVCASAFFIAIFPSFSSQSEEFFKILEGYPEAVIKAFGISSRLFTIMGFYAYIFTYILLAGAIQAMNLGLSIFSKEIRMKTADFLMTKPVARVKIVTSKLVAGTVILAITNIVFIICAYMLLNLVKTEDFSFNIFLLISLSMFFIQMIFMILGCIVAITATKIKATVGISMGTVFSFFVINMLESIIGKEAMKYVSPFKYFEASYIIQNSSYEAKFVILAIILAFIGIVGSYFIYSKKDIHAV